MVAFFSDTSHPRAICLPSPSPSPSQQHSSTCAGPANSRSGSMPVMTVNQLQACPFDALMAVLIATKVCHSSVLTPQQRFMQQFLSLLQPVHQNTMGVHLGLMYKDRCSFASSAKPPTPWQCTNAQCFCINEFANYTRQLEAFAGDLRCSARAPAREAGQ